MIPQPLLTDPKSPFFSFSSLLLSHPVPEQVTNSRGNDTNTKHQHQHHIGVPVEPLLVLGPSSVQSVGGSDRTQVSKSTDKS